MWVRCMAGKRLQQGLRAHVDTHGNKHAKGGVSACFNGSSDSEVPHSGMPTHSTPLYTEHTSQASTC